MTGETSPKLQKIESVLRGSCVHLLQKLCLSFTRLRKFVKDVFREHNEAFTARATTSATTCSSISNRCLTLNLNIVALSDFEKVLLSIALYFDFFTFSRLEGKLHLELQQ